MQQLLALLGVPDLGLFAYIVIASAGTFALAVPSWHFIERPAMSLKHWTPRQRTTAGDQASGTKIDGVPVPSAGTTHTSLAEGPLPERGRP